MQKNLITAALIAAGILAWLLSGLFRDEPAPEARSTEVVSRAQDLVRVRAREVHAQQRVLTRILRGRTASKRSASVSAETGGRVIRRPVERGQRVEAGDLLCELAPDAREATLAEARADLARAQLEQRGARELKGRELLSEIRIAQVDAELAAAEARVERAALDLARTRIAAPFAGVVEDLQLEVGDLATVGTTCATLLDLDPLLLTAEVSERDVDYIRLGSEVTARTSTDQRLEGRVTFVGSQSDPVTRTFPVEITVPNPEYALRAGMTAVVSVSTDTVLAHQVSPALFTLDDDGVLGLRAVDRDNRVVFHPIRVVEDAADGAWVTGLPGVVRLITVGQEFVSAGQRVEVIDDSVAPATAALL
jgi:multidrug efflux system membrane fusion protein